MTKKKMIVIVVGIGTASTVGMIAYSLYYGRYIDAVAISSIVPVLLWFALGSGKGSGSSPD
ncbi:MAG: hypothetical protein ACTSV1_08685 [Alphaproteobacteria bacterium]